MSLRTVVTSVFTGKAAKINREVCTHISSKLVLALGAHSHTRGTWLDETRGLQALAQQPAVLVSV